MDPDGEDEDDGFGGSSGSSESEEEQIEDVESPPVAALNAMTLTPPPTPTPIRRLYTETLSTLRLVRLLYPALKKRRIQNFPPIISSTNVSELPSIAQVSSFDRLMKHLQDFSEGTDTLAGSLYSHDQEGAQDELEVLRTMALHCVEESKLDCSGMEDGFTAWSEKWKERFASVGPATHSS